MFNLSFQRKLNVQKMAMNVTKIMQNAHKMVKMVTILVNATLDSLVMERHAQVSIVLYCGETFLALI